MPSAAALRTQIESALSHRIPAALTPVARVQREVAATGLPSLDDLLHGGLPIGAISELVGPLSSGRTSAALSFLAQRTTQGQVCAWIDVQDSLDPESAAANGIRLQQLLWVRCGSVPSPCSHPQIESKIPAELACSQIAAPPHPPAHLPLAGCGGAHPRSEARGMDRAVEELMRRRATHIRDKTIGTPGVGNRALSTTPRPVPRDEQVSSDRAPKRRGNPAPAHPGAFAPCCAEAVRKPRPETLSLPTAHFHSPKSCSSSRSPAPAWTLLDQALRATDLLLQAGGFSAIVLDMGDTAPQHSSRIPLATWFRYRQAADQSRCSLIVLTQRPCAGSSAEAVIRFEPLALQHAGGRVLASAGFRAGVTRQRFQPHSSQSAIEIGNRRKPVASVSTWTSGMRDAV